MRASAPADEKAVMAKSTRSSDVATAMMYVPFTQSMSARQVAGETTEVPKQGVRAEMRRIAVLTVESDCQVVPLHSIAPIVDAGSRVQIGTELREPIATVTRDPPPRRGTEMTRSADVSTTETAK